mmetsp:Transcript_3882/g.8676  ORF Transcript_3882/g.8676 Transcript_3882/m.8676 type:complete len:155 (+) Transcript_3882:111-575(+)
MSPLRLTLVSRSIEEATKRLEETILFRSECACPAQSPLQTMSLKVDRIAARVSHLGILHFGDPRRGGQRQHSPAPDEKETPDEMTVSPAPPGRSAEDDAGPASEDHAGPAGGGLRRVAAARRAVPRPQFYTSNIPSNPPRNKYFRDQCLKLHSS